MKRAYLLLCLGILFLSGHVLGQEEVAEVTWKDLDVTEFTKQTDENGLEIALPEFNDFQQGLDGKKIIISGNYHILNSFGSKSFLLSRDEIIKTPMQGDEVLRLIMEEDPKIYFGRTVKIQGVIHIDKNTDAETIYYVTDVKKVKNTGKVEE